MLAGMEKESVASVRPPVRLFPLYLLNQMIVEYEFVRACVRVLVMTTARLESKDNVKCCQSFFCFELFSVVHDRRAKNSI